MNEAIFNGILAGNMAGVKASVQEALDAGAGPGEILNDSMVTAMAEVGRRFENAECFVPELLIAARAMKAGVELLKPHLVAAKIEPKGKMIVGTVRGDMHDIGKNLVGMMVEGAGWEIVDLGVDVSPDRFVAAIQEHKPKIVGMSALLTTTMPNIAASIKAMEAAGVRDQVTVMIGGAPVTEEYARQVGADFYATDAAAAAEKVKNLG